MVSSNLENIKGIPHYDFEDSKWYKEAKVNCSYTEIVDGVVSYIYKNRNLSLDQDVNRCVEVLKQAGLKPTTLIHERIGALCVRVVIKDYIKTYPER